MNLKGSDTASVEDAGYPLPVDGLPLIRMDFKDMVPEGDGGYPVPANTLPLSRMFPDVIPFSRQVPHTPDFVPPEVQKLPTRLPNPAF